MIPLRSTDGVSEFPHATLRLCVGLLITNIIFYFIEPKLFIYLGQLSSVGPSFDSPKSFLVGLLVSAVFSPSIFKLVVNLLFFWVFSPVVFQKRRRFGVFVWLGLLGVWLARESFFRLHPEYAGPLPAFDATVGVLLGMSLRSEIWATVSTLVIGLGWIRIFEVPSYVLLFFWLFYLFLGNLFLALPYSDAPMLYWLPFVGLLIGFFGEITVTWFEKRRDSRSET